MGRICRGLQRLATRALTIRQATHVSDSKSTFNNLVSNKYNLRNIEELPNLKSMGALKMEAIGNPPSAMSIGLPPSLPIYLRRHSILAIQGDSLHITITNVTVHFLKRLLYGNFVSKFQKLVGTEPISLIVTSTPLTWLSSIVRNTTTKSFASVALDGACDWAILKPDALHLYAGPSVNVGIHALPRRISRQLARHLGTRGKESTGLFRWTRAGYTFVSGRGTIGIAGNGVIYALQIAEGDELSINRDNLVGLSVNGPHDLQNCVIQYSHPVSEEVRKESQADFTQPRVVSVRSWHDLVINSKNLYWMLRGFFDNLRSKVSRHHVGDVNFVRVIGPRSILMQSGGSNQSFESSYKLGSPERAKPTAQMDRSPADYLNVVTIDASGNPSIQSTADFNDRVAEFQKHRS